MQCLAIRRQGIHFDILHCLVLDVVFGSGIALYFMKYFDITLFGITPSSIGLFLTKLAFFGGKL